MTGSDWAGGTKIGIGRIDDLDRAAHPPVIRAAPRIAVVGVRAGLVEGEGDFFHLAGIDLAQVYAQPRPDGDPMRDVHAPRSAGLRVHPL